MIRGPAAASVRPVDRPLPNFRDLGGHPAAGGRVVSGKVFRAASLSKLRDEEARRLVEVHGVLTYVDFRTPSEIRWEGEPRAVREAGIEWKRLPLDLADDVFRGGGLPTRETWVEVYARGLEKHSRAFVELVRTVAGAEGAVVIGCSAGKDRTGIAVALLLSALGVAHEAIVADYVRTTEGLAPHLGRYEVLWGDDAKKKQLVVEAFFVAHPEVMRGFLERVEDHWGSLPDAIDLDAATLARLRARLVG